MGLDDVLELLKEQHHLQRPPDYVQGSLVLISGPIIDIIQALTPSIDSRVLSSINTRQREKTLKQTLKTLENDPQVRSALRSKGYKSMSPELKLFHRVVTTGLRMDPYVGNVNGEAIAAGIVNETGLIWKSNGKNVAGIIAVHSTAGPYLYGCLLLETGLIQYSSHFKLAGVTFSCGGFIVPPGVPIDLLQGTGKVPADEYQIANTSDFSDSRKYSPNLLAQRFDTSKKVNVKAFEPVFRETLQAARKLGAEEQLRVKAYREMSRCAEYAVMLANAYARLQPAR